MVDGVHFMRVMKYFLKKESKYIDGRDENEVWISL
jgi:hypothetical protein